MRVGIGGGDAALLFDRGEPDRIEVGDGGNETGRMVPEGGNVPPPHAEADDSDTQLLHYHALPRPSNSRGGTFTQRGSPRTGPGAAQRAALPRIRRTSAL